MQAEKPLLISPLCDPEGRYLSIIKKWAYRLTNFYSQVILGISHKTSPKVLNYLKDLEFTIDVGNYPYGKAYRQALSYGLKQGGSIFHCSDFDRILHWLAKYPKELQRTLNRKVSADYLILGRTTRAFKTHPRSWQLTEKVTNTLISKVLGFNADICTGSAILNQKAAQIILGQSKEKDFTILAEWPILVKEAGLKVKCLLTKGYEWENPDRFGKEIKKIGYEKWFENYNSPNEWKKRLKVTNQIAALILKSLDS